MELASLLLILTGSAHSGSTDYSWPDTEQHPITKNTSVSSIMGPGPLERFAEAKLVCSSCLSSRGSSWCLQAPSNQAIQVDEMLVESSGCLDCLGMVDLVDYPAGN